MPWRTRTCNASITQTEADIVGKTDFDLYPEDVARAIAANDQLVLQTGAQINDKDARMWNGLGRAHFELGQFQEAIDAYSKAKAIDPDGVDALYGLGMAYAELNKRKEAKENLELFVSKAGQDTRPDLIKAARDTVARMADVI